MLNIFIGYDKRETVAYHVLAHSILKRATQPVAIVPINLDNISDIFNREKDKLQSTDFSFSRFLVPYLSNYEGWSLFIDCDILVLDDIDKLFDYCDDKYSVMCVKHNHVPKETIKFLGATQTKYSKKNWSSVMLFNNSECKKLTLEYVNTASGLDLHQFNWLPSDDSIGEIPSEWNHLVGYDAPRDDAKLVHYTIGGPYFNEYTEVEYADEWREELNAILYRENK
jgi:lipopolysaccharide biosynthesis glycosyltransferase